MPDRATSFERLEFLGDSVLQLVVTVELMRRFPQASEGDLAWMRQSVVSGERCAAAAREGRLPEAFREQAPPRERAVAGRMGAQLNIQAALAEAVIGAAWRELGPERTTEGVVAAFGAALDDAVPGARDAKTSLQERLARRRRTVSYRLDEAVGPPHARVFRMSAVVDDEVIGSGEGRSKQAAERAAALAALRELDVREA